MKKDRFTTGVLIIIFFTGLSLLLYPSVANYVNSLHQSKAITGYSEEVASISPEEYQRYLRQAYDYNLRILDRQNVFTPSQEEKERYEAILNISGNGAIGYIEIPSIDVVLPIYHGTSERVLQVAVGHLDWTSLPVGGENTHCVLSGHRGLPSAKLFTHLDKLAVGDIFMIRVLDEVLTYEVDQILIVDPKDTEPLQIVKGKDYCTLLTCTPYGINTHRLLVRGHRVENAQQAASVNIISEAVQIEPMIISAITGVPVLILLMAAAFIRIGIRDRHRTAGKRNEQQAG